MVKDYFIIAKEIKDLRFQFLKNDSWGLKQAEIKFQDYSLKILPKSFYFILSILGLLVLVGVFLPLLKLSGFDFYIFISFATLVLVFLVSLIWWMKDFKKKFSIQVN